MARTGATNEHLGATKSKPSTRPMLKEVGPDGTVVFKKRGSNCPSVVRFPNKLWNIIHSCDSGAIGWTVDGEGIFVNYNLFKNEFLAKKSSNESLNNVFSQPSSVKRDKNDFTCNQSQVTSNSSQVHSGMSSKNIFKTSQIASFIRQLNMYGFRKVVTISGIQEILESEYLDEDFAESFVNTVTESKPELQIFHNPCFIRGHPDLVDTIVRCTNATETRDRSWVPPKRLKRVGSSVSEERSTSFRRRSLLDGFLTSKAADDDDCVWLNEQLGNLPDLDDNFLDLLQSDKDIDVDTQELLRIPSGGGPQQEKGTKKNSPISGNKRVELIPLRSNDTTVRSSLNLVSIDDCIKLLESSSHESWTSFKGQSAKTRVRQLPLYQIMDTEISPIASVMTTSDPFISTGLFPELY